MSPYYEDEKYYISRDDSEAAEQAGVKHRSGRYKFGSGDIPYQHEPWFTWGKNSFYNEVQEKRAQGMSDTEIAKSMGYSTTKFRTLYTVAKDDERMLKVAAVKSLSDSGKTILEIEKMTGIPENTVRSLLNTEREARTAKAKATANFLKSQVDQKGMIDISVGVELESELNVSRDKLKEAVHILEGEGYVVLGRRVDQVTDKSGRNKTTMTVLCPPGTPKNALFQPHAMDNIQTITEYTAKKDENGNDEFFKFEYPSSMDSKRLQIIYAEDGGKERDGLVEIRRGVQDLNMGKSNYAQVRIMVDNKYYIKGMAVYADDLPDGIDIRFNSNKPKAKGLEGALKPIEPGENPFGALIKAGGQDHYIDPATGEKKLGLINKRSEEGDWKEWADKLPSQFLSKQNRELVKKQLDITIADKEQEYAEIMQVTNPVVKSILLENFASSCDSDAVHLKAAPLPQQKYQVIIPIPEAGSNYIYAPNYENGEKVALIRYPHEGTFQIPVLTVNNRIDAAKKVLGTLPVDAVGISKQTAEQMSGADFDGDTVMVIPLRGGKVNITARPPLERLKDFDPDIEYPERPGMKYMTKKNINTEMGKISNLITDMTLLGATDDELARAVRHSMVVIDAYKHKYDYTRSYAENRIGELKKKYQVHYDEDGNLVKGGASTIVSLAKSEKRVLKRQGSPHIDAETGKLIWKTADDAHWVDYKTGEIHDRTQKSTKMMEVDDAFKLVSRFRNPKEILYAEFANKLKSMANEARKEYMRIDMPKKDSAAEDTYADEVNSLMAKLNEAIKNKPRERAAQRLANAAKERAKELDPELQLDTAEARKALGKIGQQAITDARAKVGAHRVEIEISDREWAAIQANAVAPKTLKEILNFADIDKVRKLATPSRGSLELGQAKQNRIRAYAASGYTISEIAEMLGVSASTVQKYMK